MNNIMKNDLIECIEEKWLVLDIGKYEMKNWLLVLTYCDGKFIEEWLPNMDNKLIKRNATISDLY